MVWTVPKTWVANTRLVDTDLNAHIRDNMSATMPSLTTMAGSYFAATGLNTLAARSIGSYFTNTFAQLTTGGTGYQLTPNSPDVTVTTGPLALILFGATMDHTAGIAAAMTVTVLGRSPAAAEPWAILASAFQPASKKLRTMGVHLFTDLTPGPTRFRGWYRGGGTGTIANFGQPFLIVVPL